MAWVECPECDEEMENGTFGDDAYCRACDQWYETDWDYVAEDSIAAWVLGKTDKKTEKLK